MLPNFLLPETVARQDGTGPILELGPAAGQPVLLTLGITRIIEQESLDLGLYGSVDGESWSEKALLAFPQKFYCGTYSLLLDLTAHPEIKHLRVKWKMSRWGRGEPAPLFSFYVFVQQATAVVNYAVA